MSDWTIPLSELQITEFLKTLTLKDVPYTVSVAWGKVMSHTIANCWKKYTGIDGITADEKKINFICKTKTYLSYTETLFSCNLAIPWDGMDWINLAQERDKWRALLNTVMNLWVP
jgi:hypothetical protein